MMTMHREVLLAPVILAAAFAASPDRASVVSSGPGGFVVREEVQFAGPPAAAWKHLVDVASWWNPQHTYSGSSSNLSLTLSPGGCWCEKLANGGFARHLEVVLAVPDKTLRLVGGLGPLQGLGATGALTFTLRSGSAGVTTVIAEYSVVGYSQQGLASLTAAVDGVLADQMARFARGQAARP
jgi:hypothetical protein